MPEGKRCSHCGGNLIPDGAYHQGEKEEYLRCLQCGRPADKEEEMARPEKKCECGKEFTPTGNSQKYCSVECLRKAKIEKAREWRDDQRAIVSEAKERKFDAGPAVQIFLAGLVPELRQQILVAARKDAIREMVAHIQATFLEG